MGQVVQAGGCCTASPTYLLLQFSSFQTYASAPEGYRHAGGKIAVGEVWRHGAQACAMKSCVDSWSAGHTDAAQSAVNHFHQLMQADD